MIRVSYGKLRISRMHEKGATVLGAGFLEKGAQWGAHRLIQLRGAPHGGLMGRAP
jgi:hypothetical protein